MVRYQQLEQVLEWAGHQASSHQVEKFEQISHWLDTEARDAGGIGPGEEVWERHILDSLMFSRGFIEKPRLLVDLGGGVGLPSLPLAVLFPDSSVTLVDRSTRRMRLVRRACRIAGIENLETIVGDIITLPTDSFDASVMRAVLPPKSAIPLLQRVTRPGGVAVLGVGLEVFHVKHGSGEDLQFSGSEVLDPGRWMHIMQIP